MKIFKLLTISILALGFLFHAPLQWSSMFVHAQADMEIDMGMDHEAAQQCLEHCMNQASQMADHPELSIVDSVVLVDSVVDTQEQIRPLNFKIFDNHESPDNQVHILTIQKRE